MVMFADLFNPDGHRDIKRNFHLQYYDLTPESTRLQI
jgi:hypothetical protein